MQNDPPKDIRTGEFIKEGNLIRGEVELLGSETPEVIWGYAAENKPTGNIDSEWWGDWIPGSYAPLLGQENDDDSNGNESGDTTEGTPGFEALAVITAIGIAFIFLRRRK